MATNRFGCCYKRRPPLLACCKRRWPLLACCKHRRSLLQTPSAAATNAARRCSPAVNVGHRCYIRRPQLLPAAMAEAVSGGRRCWQRGRDATSRSSDLGGGAPLLQGGGAAESPLGLSPEFRAESQSAWGEEIFLTAGGCGRCTLVGGPV